MLGDDDRVFEWLERAYEDREFGLHVFLKTDPKFARLYPNPRFQALLRRMEFPEELPGRSLDT